MGKRRERNTSHAEGEHGAKTEARIIAQLESAPPRQSTEDRIEHDRETATRWGKRRLVEDRQQHDESEKNSERNRREELG